MSYWKLKKRLKLIEEVRHECLIEIILKWKWKKWEHVKIGCLIYNLDLHLCSHFRVLSFALNYSFLTM